MSATAADADEWIDQVAMRPMLEALLESVCKDKPDRLLQYAIWWMRESYPEQAREAAVDIPLEWTPRTDIEASPEALMAYLKDVDATVTLEGIIERAIRVMPTNVVAFVVVAFGVVSLMVFCCWWSCCRCRCCYK